MQGKLANHDTAYLFDLGHTPARFHFFALGVVLDRTDISLISLHIEIIFGAEGYAIEYSQRLPILPPLC